MDLYLFNNDKEIIDVIPSGEIVEYSQESELNFLITSKVRGEYRANLDEVYYYGSQDVDDRSKFWRYRVDEFAKEDGMFRLFGSHEFFDDLKTRKIHEDHLLTGQTAISALQFVLDGTGWEIGRTVSSQPREMNIFYVTALDAFWHYLTLFNVEFRLRMDFEGGVVTGRYVDLYQPFETDHGRLYEYGNNLIKVVQEQKNTEMFTAAYGRGKGELVSLPEEHSAGRAGYRSSHTFSDVVWSVANGDPVDKPLGQEYVEIPSATAQYGHPDGTPRFGIFKFSDTENHETLLWQTYNQLLEGFRPLVEFEADVFETDLVDLGEVVNIMRPDMDIRYKTRIFNIERDFLVPERKTIKFGDKLAETRADQVRKHAVDRRIAVEEENSILEGIVGRIQQSYYNDHAYTYDITEFNENGWGYPAGIYSFDAPIDEDPTKVVYVGAGKILIANSKNSDGTWNWRTALDGDGIGTDMIGARQIQAHVIEAQHFQGDVLTAKNITLVNGDTVQQTLDSMTTTLDGSRTWSDYPIPPYLRGQVWHQPSQTWGDIEARGWTWGDIEARHLQWEDIEGGYSYVCEASRATGILNRNDWRIIKPDAREIEGLTRRISDTESELTSAQLTLRDQGYLISSNGSLVEKLEQHVSEISARKISMSELTPVDTGSMMLNRSVELTVDNLLFRHANGAVSTYGLDGAMLTDEFGVTSYLARVRTVPFRGDGARPVRVETPPEFRSKPYICAVMGADSGQAPSDGQVHYRAGRSYYGSCPPQLIPDGGPAYNSERVYVMAYQEWIDDRNNARTRDGMVPAQGVIIFIA